MLFNSYIFLFCMLPITLVLYYGFNTLGKHQLGLVSLLGMSLWFYGYFNPSYLAILCASILINWFLSLAMRKNRAKKLLLMLGLCFNVGLIFYFKYFDFFISSVNDLFQTNAPLLNILLPLGISFFTFQQISYIVDAYQGKATGYHFLEYAVFVSFFPQLIAGPIVLHNELIPQLSDTDKKRFDYDHFAKGLYTLALGMFKKVIVADSLGIIVNTLWAGSSSDFTTASAWVATFGYALQLYYDFSGYSDMAIGLGHLFNLSLPINFNSPYKACSVGEFWTRWHITLSRFLRTYIYFPLGGNRKGLLRCCCNIMVVFLVSGLWHGANWTFVLWGVLHGVASVIERLFERPLGKIPRAVRWFPAFGFFSITYMIFRADSVAQAMTILQKMFAFDGLGIGEPFMTDYVLPKILPFVSLLSPLGISINTLGVLFFVVLLGGIILFTVKAPNLHEKPFEPTLCKAFVTVAALMISLLSFSTFSTFLYFNF